MMTRNSLRTVGLAALALVLGMGWASREMAFARERAKDVESKTVALSEVKMQEAEFEGKRSERCKVDYFCIWVSSECMENRQFCDPSLSRTGSKIDYTSSILRIQSQL